MSALSDRLRDLVPHVRGTGLDGRGHALVRDASDALDAMEAALGSAWYFIAAFDRDGAPNVLAEIKAALAKLEGK